MAFFMIDLFLAVTMCYTPVPGTRSLPGLSSLSCHLAAGKTHISHCQELNILTSLYLLDLPSNSKPNSSIFKPLIGAGKTPPVCFMHFTPRPPISPLLCLHFGGQPVPDFTFREFWCKLKKGVFLSILPQLKLWIIISVINFVLNPHWRFPSNTLARAPCRRQMCSHGNRTVSALLACQVKPTSAGEEPAGDLTDLTSVQQWESQAGEKKTEKQAVFKLCERLSMLDPSTLYLLLPRLRFSGLIVSILFTNSFLEYKVVKRVKTIRLVAREVG